MSKFDYEMFVDHTTNKDYGLVFNQTKYDKSTALNEASCELEIKIDKLQAEEVYIRFSINRGEAYYYDSGYITCDEYERGAFKCWKITEVKEGK